MTQHWTDDYGKPAISVGIRGELSGGKVLFLFKSNTTPDHTTNFGGLTECDFPGYARIPVIGTWSVVGVDGSFNYVVQDAAYVWTCTGSSPANDVYGYGVLDSGNNLLMAEKNPAGPITIDASGLTYTVVFKLFSNNNPAP